MIKETTTLVNDRVVTHKDVIYHTTTTTFRFIDRIRILFGKRVIIQSDIFTMNDEAKVVATKATTHVEKVFRRKLKGYGVIQTGQEVNHEA
jgi:hypothetical protein